MAMKYVETYGSDFFDWFISLLMKPLSLGADAYSNKKQLLFLVFCALIGATIGSLIPGRPPISERAQTAVVLVAIWTFTSVLIYFACRILRGKGSLEHTVLASLRVLAVAYVVSNTITMLVTMAESTNPQIRGALSATGLTTPGNIILFIQFCMVAVYTPMVLNSVHKFGGLIVGTMLGLLAALIAVLVATPVVSAGGC